MNTCNHTNHYYNANGDYIGVRHDVFGRLVETLCFMPLAPPPIVGNDPDLQEVVDEQIRVAAQRSIEDIVDEYGRIRGDLGQPYAREQMVRILEAKQQFVRDAADVYTDKAEELDYKLRQADMLSHEVRQISTNLKQLAFMADQTQDAQIYNTIHKKLVAILDSHALRVADDATS